MCFVNKIENKEYMYAIMCRLHVYIVIDFDVLDLG